MDMHVSYRTSGSFGHFLSVARCWFGSSHVLDEAERSLHDALCVLVATVEDSRVIWGGGWPEFLMARRVEELGRRTPGKKSLAIDAFAAALRAIPTTIADNAGLDSADLVSQLRAAHSEDGSRSGIDVISGEVQHVNIRSPQRPFL
jgi:T-complex protein 1 subunit beta